MSSNWVLVLVNSYVMPITEFGYFFFDRGHLEVAMIVSLVTYQGASIKDLKIVKEFLC